MSRAGTALLCRQAATQQAAGHGRAAAVNDGPEPLHGPFNVRDRQIRRDAQSGQAGEGLPQAADCLCRLR